MTKDPVDDDLFEGTFNKDKNYQDQILREHGYEPKELTDDEKRTLLADLDDPGDPDDSKLSSADPDDQ